MQELVHLSSASAQSATHTTLGCSANSTLQTQTNNHDSLQQNQIQTQSQLAPSAAAYDPVSKKLFAVMHVSEESKTESEEAGPSSSLLHMSA